MLARGMLSGETVADMQVRPLGYNGAAIVVRRRGCGCAAPVERSRGRTQDGKRQAGAGAFEVLGYGW